MGQPIATATVQLDADAVKLIRELKKAEGKTKQFGDSAGKNFANAGKAMAKVGVAAFALAGALAFKAVSSGIERIDKLAKTADKLGISLKNLAGLQQAAEITGASQEGLNKALVKQQKAIADANTGLETYARHFRTLNLDTQKLAELNPAEQFKIMADALNKVENQTLKTSIAADIYGSRNTDLINTLRLGSKGLNEFEAEAEALGLALSRVDAAKVEAANDAMLRIGKVLEGAGNKLTVALAPTLEALANAFVDSAKGAGDFDQIIETITTRTIIGFGLMKNSILVVADAWHVVEIAAWKTGEATYRVLSIANDSFTFLADQAALQASIASAAIAQNATEIKSYAELEKAAVDFHAKVEAAAQRQAEAVAKAADARIIPETGGTEGATPAAITAPDSATYKAALDEQLAYSLANAQAIAEGELVIDAALAAAKLEGRMVTDAQLIEMSKALATGRVLAEFEAEQAAKGELGIAATETEKLELQQAIGQQANAIAADISAERVRIAAAEAKTLLKYDLTTFQGKANTLNATLGLASSFNKKSKALQLASLVASKAIAIKDSIIAITGGVAKALNNPYPANLAFAASVAAEGAGLLSTLASVGGGGGGGGGSAPSVGGGGSVYDPGGLIEEEKETEKAVSSVQIIIQGNLIGNDEYVRAQLIPAFQEAIKERDVVLISSNSRNGQELAGVTA